MLRQLTIRGFKAFEEASVPLQPFTVLIGPNGAGKSTILQAIDLLGWLVTGTIGQYLEQKGWEYSDLPHLRAPAKRFSITAELEFSRRNITWELGLGTRRRAGIESETVVLGDGTTVMERQWRRMTRWQANGAGLEEVTQTLTSSWLSTVEQGDQARLPDLLPVAQWARRIRGYFFLDPVLLRAPSRGDSGEIGVHGETLAPFLARLRERRRNAFERLKERVQQYYPRLQDLHPVRGKDGRTYLEVTEKWGKEVVRLNARQVSDGLLRLIAVSAMHELETPPSVLLLDEIENGLHPHLLGGFVQMLQKFVESQNGATQVILATHSPITVNYCESAKGVILVTRNRKGHPVCLPLSQTRDFDKLRPHFDLGELWYNLGEERLV